MAETAFPFEEEEKTTSPLGDERPMLRVVETPAETARPQARGKFFFVGDDKFWVKGVTYGTFRPNSDGDQYPKREQVAFDFKKMAAAGFNSVRVYTAPPIWLLDEAQAHGLRVMVGLWWDQYITFLDDPRRATRILEDLRETVAAYAGHPAILAYALANEIPASIVRWHGADRIERFLRDLYELFKREDPDALVTYVNYPTTEYLDLSFADFLTFNVYLETPEQLSAYLKRLHNIAGDRPVVMGEIGLDSSRNSEEGQAEALNWQIRTIFGSGCSGAFVFAWTDEWHCAGFDITDWSFGLTTTERDPKPALDAVRGAFIDTPFRKDQDWPRISVVICSLNGGRTIRDTLEACTSLNYPNFEVIVVSDGSTDSTPSIAREYDVRLFCTENRGLSAARNLGLCEATGEIVAYIDDDAYPDPDWLSYLADTFQNTDHAGVGGPNIPPPNDGFVAACVSNAPGGPNHVLLSDDLAEHIPGCNMAFRKGALEAIGGFDERFRVAGDDVDICWTLQDRGWTIGFHPAAKDWHHRRNSICAYWRQQKGYGKAEALLEQKWPGKFEALGHHAWSGRIYGQGVAEALGLQRPRIYQGTWGLAPFQSLYQPAQSLLAHLPQMPEWYLALGGLTFIGSLGLNWSPLLVAWGAVAIGLGGSLWLALKGAIRARFYVEDVPRPQIWKARTITALLFLLHPIARLSGRLRHGLRPWRRNGKSAPSLRFWQRLGLWSERWRPHDDWLRQLETEMKDVGAVVRKGGDFDPWDLDVRGGFFGSARVLMAIEEHGGGKQMVRFRSLPDMKIIAPILALTLSLLAMFAYLDSAAIAAGGLGVAAVLIAVHALCDLALATGIVRASADRLGKKQNEPFVEKSDSLLPAAE